MLISAEALDELVHAVGAAAADIYEAADIDLPRGDPARERRRHFFEGFEGKKTIHVGLVGLHMTRTLREWLDDEVSFLESIARQIAIGYQYTRLYIDKEREAETKRALLEIANALNAMSRVSPAPSNKYGRRSRAEEKSNS